MSFPNSFLIYKPKDIVAGDFYWHFKTDKNVYFAIADCTGHGVPGALVSVICHNALDTVVNRNKEIDPGSILDEVKTIITNTFSNSGKHINDGMDISLIKYDFKKQKLLWAGANNPLWQLSADNMLEVYKANKQPVGNFEKGVAFTTHQINFKKGDSFYLFTDGFSDQFGGENDKKFKTANFKKLVIDLNNSSMAHQKTEIENTFENWKLKVDQVDDVAIFGFVL